MKKILVLAFIGLVACKGMPEKPNVWLCAIDLPRDRMVCAPTGQINDLKKMTNKELLAYLNASQDKLEIPMPNTDKFICFPPKDFERITVYSKEVRDRLEQCYKGN